MQELQAAGVDTTDFAERAQELRQELEDVASEQALKDYDGSAAQKKWYEVYSAIREQSTNKDQWFEREFQWEADLAAHGRKREPEDRRGHQREAAAETVTLGDGGRCSGPNCVAFRQIKCQSPLEASANGNS